MSKKDYRVGVEIEAHCTKCKIDRLHVIQALKSDGNIHKVICKTCEGTHLFRRPKGDGTKTKAPSKRRKKGSVILTDAEAAKAKAYSMTGIFALGDFIQHPTFGPGKVVEVRSAGKMEVGFENGAKLLVCGFK